MKCHFALGLMAIPVKLNGKEYLEKHRHQILAQHLAAVIIFFFKKKNLNFTPFLNKYFELLMTYIQTKA